MLKENIQKLLKAIPALHEQSLYCDPKSVALWARCLFQKSHHVVPFEVDAHGVFSTTMVKGTHSSSSSSSSSGSSKRARNAFQEVRTEVPRDQLHTLVPTNEFFTERSHSPATRGIIQSRAAANGSGGLLASLQQLVQGSTGSSGHSSGIGIGDALLATATRRVINPVVPIFLSASLDSTRQLFSSSSHFQASSKDDLISGQPLIARVKKQHARPNRESIMNHYIQQEKTIRLLLRDIHHDDFDTYQSTILFVFNDIVELRTANVEWKERSMPRGDHPFVTLWVRLINIKALPGLSETVYNYSSDSE